MIFCQSISAACSWTNTVSTRKKNLYHYIKTKPYLAVAAKSNHLVQSQNTAWAQSFREKSNQSGKVNPKKSKPNGHTTIGHVFRSSSIYTKVRAHCRILAILIDLNIPFCADHIGTSTLTNKIYANYKVRFLKEDKHVKLLLRPKRLHIISYVQGSSEEQSHHWMALLDGSSGGSWGWCFIKSLWNKHWIKGGPARGPRDSARGPRDPGQHAPTPSIIQVQRNPCSNKKEKNVAHTTKKWKSEVSECSTNHSSWYHFP